MDPAHQHQHQHQQDGLDSLGDVLDLDAEVLADYLSEATGWIAEKSGFRRFERILDLGAGTGTGTLALAERFPEAEILAVDSSTELLGRLTGKLTLAGLTGRVRTVRADLDQAWPGIGEIDLVWAANFLHHLQDPLRVLGELRTALRPDGLLAVAEMQAQPTFLPDATDPDSLEARSQALLSRQLVDVLPHLGADWRPLLQQAGFSVQGERILELQARPPHRAPVGRYAQGTLRRVRQALDGIASATDLTALNGLIADDGPDSVLHRDDLVVRARRTVWLAG